MDADIQRRLAGRLLRGERVLWTGRPKQGLLLSAVDFYVLPISILMLAQFSIIFYRVLRARSEFLTVDILPFYLISAIVLLFNAVRYGLDAWLRARTFYAVTDRRILIWREGRWASFKVVERARLEAVELKGGGRRGTLRFGSVSWGGTPPLIPILRSSPQFLAIENPQQVFDLIQNTQPEATATA